MLNARSNIVYNPGWKSRSGTNLFHSTRIPAVITIQRVATTGADLNHFVWKILNIIKKLELRDENLNCQIRSLVFI